MVFAHYMVAWPRAGANAAIEDYQTEIREAIAHGIDGFALNCGGWSRSEPHYKRRVLQIFEAASALKADFWLFVSADGRAQDEVEDIVRSTADLPNQLKVNGKPVLSTYSAGGGNSTKRASLIKLSRELGVFFVPHFVPDTGEEEIKDRQAQELISKLGGADGYFYFGAAGSPWVLASSIRMLSDRFRAVRTLFMSSVTPYYRGLYTGTNYRAFETYGFVGMAMEWEAAIHGDADWVQIVTWNDWAESTYVAPLLAAERGRVFAERFNDMLSHKGYLEASKYYISWFKRGRRPEINRDEIFYFYRLHPVDVSEYGEWSSLGKKGVRSLPRTKERLSPDIHVTLLLKDQAEFTVNIDGRISIFKVGRGVTHLSVASHAGIPRFTLHRWGSVIIDKVGELEISSDDFSGQYNYFAGSAKG
ncbi:glycoside hydrolase family 71 protein [Cupriavidus consociatus]|uniref:glycoside hydrolase family 71 protein n=1 Tax=Cupriavidus consociatus TaxID=2821357 RepID=UPI001AE2690B|nr:MULTISPECIES: glycoside hydrolase family 71 protein [unclassified Cupriavidus]MBP0624938.1 glycoside hydrolase family 71 [Cupriavidus sp. LEh25]MDK2661670.1 glycoside hydrolase family 71 protein [Cupriavidus sp. LEh21]